MKLKPIIFAIIIFILIIQISTLCFSSGTMSFFYTGENFNIWGEGVKTTYSDNGYKTYLKVGSKEAKILKGEGTLDGVHCKINLSCVSDNNYVKVAYKITNNSTVTKTVGVASFADIMIGGNDYAPIVNLSGNKGFTMTGDGHVFKFLARNTYSVTDVDAYWFGQYQVVESRKWSTSYTFDYSSAGDRRGDSAMAYSWQNRTLAPGQSLDLSVLIGVGQLNNPPTITANNFAKSTYYPGEVVNVYGTVNDVDTGDVVSVKYAVDGGKEIVIATGIVPNGTAKPYNTSFTVPEDIVAGDHFVDVWAVDKNGDMSSTVRVYFNVVVDRTPPTGTHTLTPNTWTNGNVKITVKATDTQTGVKGITLPNGSFVQGDTANYTVSANGTYTFKLTDNTGNTGNYSVSVANIDKIKPSISLANTNKKWTSQNVAIDFTTADGQSGVQKVLLPNGQTVTTAKGKYNVSQNGTYKFIVYDVAGNYTSEKIVIANVDKVPPTLKLEARTDWVSDKVIIKWQSQDNESGVLKMKLPNNTYNSSTTGEYTVTENGTYTFVVYDNVGNQTTKTISVNNIDKIAPKITTSQETQWDLEQVKINWQVQDNESGIKEIILPNGSISQQKTGTLNVTQNGTYEFVVYDNVGNSTTKQVIINNIDKKGPKIDLNMKSEWSPDKVEINWKVVDAESGIREVILPNSQTTVEEQGKFIATENGIYTFVVYDNLGNMGMAKIEVNNIDKINPEIELTLNMQEWTNQDIDIMWKANDIQSGINEIITPDGETAIYKNGTHTVTKNGTYTIIAYDNVGNQTVEKIKIENIDKIKPTIELEQEKLEDGNINIIWTVDDTESGIKEIVLPNGEKMQEKEGRFLAEESGIYTFLVYDKAGNYQEQEIIIEK